MFRVRADRGVTEFQARGLHWPDVVQVRQVKLNLAVEGTKRLIGIAVVPLAEIAKLPENLRIEFSDEFQYLRLNVVHVGQSAELY